MTRKWTRAKRTVFLEHLARTGNVTEAARLVGCSRTGVYRLKAGNAEFAAAWSDAESAAVEALEAEARRRALDGIEQPLVQAGRVVLNQDGSVATVRRYSDRLLEFLLRARRPETYRRDQAPVVNAEAALSDEDLVRQVCAVLSDAAARRGGGDP